MNRILRLLAIAVIIFLPAELSAQTGLTLDEAIKKALENNKDIKVAIMEVEKSAAAVDEAFGYALPTVDVSANFGHFFSKPKTPFPDIEAILNNSIYGTLFQEGIIPPDMTKLQPMGTELMSLAQTNNFETKAEVRQVLFSSAVFRGIGASEVYLDLSKEMLKSQVSKSVLNVKKAFYGVLLTQQLLDIMQASYDNAKENLSNVDAMYEQGLVSEYDKMQVEVRVENLKPQIIELQNKLDETKDGLKILMGYVKDEDFTAVGKIEYDSAVTAENEILIDSAYRENYDIRSLEMKIEVDEAFVDLDRSEYWPTVAAFGNYTYAGNSDEWDFMTYNSSMIGIGLQINLFNGWRTTNKVEQSLIEKRKTGEKLQLTKHYIATQIKSKTAELERFRELIIAQDRVVALAQKAYDIAVTRYKEGTGTQLDIKNADIELRAAKTNRLKTVFNFTSARLELEDLLGKVDQKYHNTVLKNVDED